VLLASSLAAGWGPAVAGNFLAVSMSAGPFPFSSSYFNVFIAGILDVWHVWVES
jgi:hypothetical protein